MTRYLATSLQNIVASALQRAGLEAGKCDIVADILIEADMMGHDTHGLALLPAYLGALEDGTMKGAGEPRVVSDAGAVAVWDGEWLSGIWLTAMAIETATAKARSCGVGAVAIGRSHHIGCLQAYLPLLTQKGLMGIVTCSDPGGAMVAPFGGVDPVFTPNPIAVGIPTEREPILADISSSITTLAMTGRAAAAGQTLPGRWLQTADGEPTDDPNVLSASPPGTLLLTGGHDHGQKGYGLSLLIEALTQGLSGYGRAVAEKRWGAATFVQVLDPEAFAGLDQFTRESSETASRCLGSRPHPSFDSVRLPGQRAQERRRMALSEGVPLSTAIAGSIEAKIAPLGLSLAEARV